jgi:hypothetical protein
VSIGEVRTPSDPGQSEPDVVVDLAELIWEHRRLTRPLAASTRRCRLTKHATASEVAPTVTATRTEPKPRRGAAVMSVISGADLGR